MGAVKPAAEQQAADNTAEGDEHLHSTKRHLKKHLEDQSKPAAVADQEGQQPAVAAVAAAREQQKQVLKSKNKKTLTKERLERLKEQHNKRGIIYISRLPPHMKPGKLRQLLSQYGEIGRIYCTPEDQALRQQRKKKGGNSGKNFTEGWIEFEDKAEAKTVAAALNGQQIGGKRRSAYHFDLWCMKYLPKFKWDHLTEEINYEKAVREQRMAQELTLAKRERDFYLSRVDKAKAQAAMAERRQKKQQSENGGGLPEPAEAGNGSAAAAGGPVQDPAAAAAAAAAAGIKRMYGQRKVKPDPSKEGAVNIGDDVLGLIVAKKQKIK